MSIEAEEAKEEEPASRYSHDPESSHVLRLEGSKTCS